jgi:pyruvate,orthophosphate dikinase
MTDLVGGKGAGLCEMSRIGLPVPPGFIITTEACNHYFALGRQFPSGLWKQVLAALKEVERATGRKFGSPRNPLLLSVRSGARFSMPGMMDTVLNLGLNDPVREALARMTGDRRFAGDAYRRFIQMFGKTVLGIEGSAFEEILEEHRKRAGVERDALFSAGELERVITEFKQLVKARTGSELPTDPREQLELAIKATFDSWNNKRAVDYRNFNRIPHHLGTAVNVQAMVFGNVGETSGAGVAFTRNPATGEKILYGEYLTNAQGEDVVAGIRTPKTLLTLRQELPQVYQELEEAAAKLEAHYRDVQDIEFTFEQGKLYLLQTRTGKRTPRAAIKIAVDMVKEGIITTEEALQRVEPHQVTLLLVPRFDERAKEEVRKQGGLLAVGLNASPGAASGKVVFDADTAEQRGLQGESVILVRPETNADDFHGIVRAKGVLTARGGMTSHAAVVARGMSKPCVVGCEVLEIDLERRCFRVNEKVIAENQEISIDGNTGEVFAGHIPTFEPAFSEEEELVTLLGWANEVKRLEVWANADTPADAVRALEFGAEGIGLCRTEHMFFAKDRLPVVQKMILAAEEATALDRELALLQEELEKAPRERQGVVAQKLHQAQEKRKASLAVKEYYESLTEIERFQREDFLAILRVMQGKSVVFRLLDPPLHEFLPAYDDLLAETSQLLMGSGDPELVKEKQRLLRAVGRMRQMNPMLGLRGCRLGLLFPAIYEMQVRAILMAASQLVKEGLSVYPEIMIPMVSHAAELRESRQLVEKVAREVEETTGVKIAYKVGTMIETPRAALTASELAEIAEFFSFGTNDLTQTTLGYSRDDAEGKFVVEYIQRGILPQNPFQVLDRIAVGRLIAIAVEEGRKARPELKVGICGEHGGEPSSIEFCHQQGLDYVSCSPFRVPAARLAAAQAALGWVERDK